MSRRIRDQQGPNDNPLVETITATGSATVGGTLDVTGAITAPGGITSVLGAGTVTTAATTVAEELGGGGSFATRLTFTDFVVAATEPDNADLAVGAKFYTVPAGAIVIDVASFYGTFTKAGEATIADGEIGIGTLIGSGAEDDLGTVGAAAENVCGPLVVTNGEFDGAQVYTAISAPALYIAPAAGLAHDLFLNVAATWPNVTPAGTLRFNGVITLKWRKIS
jgi:hypothetical protein